jgi:RND family efflux transporter MFP subunit
MRGRTWIVLLLGVATVVLLVAALDRVREPADEQGDGDEARRPVPVEVAAVERGPIELRRTFTGTLETRAELVAAPKVSGRIERLAVDLADRVTRGQVVAELDNAEYVQAVAQARADLAVARANLTEAQSQLKIAGRELERVESLRERGVSSASERDLAKADQLAKQARVQVSRAQLARAEAQLETARIRLGYTEVTADWRGGADRRVVAERYVDEGETVSANAPLLRIVELNPITGVFFVTERDYALLAPGQAASLATDAYPGEAFQGRIARIAPVFRESTRQARVELEVANPDGRLKPGMFVRATVVLDRADDAVIVPEQALVVRDGRSGVFRVSADGRSAVWQSLQLGIRDGQRVQVLGDLAEGRVVVLGQQLLDDGSAIRVAGERSGGVGATASSMSGPGGAVRPAEAGPTDGPTAGSAGAGGAEKVAGRPAEAGPAGTLGMMAGEGRTAEAGPATAPVGAGGGGKVADRPAEAGPAAAAGGRGNLP